MRASSLPLLLKCPGSASLPTDNTKSDKAQGAADWGTMVHQWKQFGVVQGPKRAANALLKAIELSAISRDELWPEGGVHETAMALYVGSADDFETNGWTGDDALLGETAEDKVGKPGWITGHSDFYWRLFDGELWVNDLKTSRLYPNPLPGLPGHVERLNVGENRFPERANSDQIKCYSLGLAEALGYTGGVHTSVTHWPRLPLLARHAAPTQDWWYWSHDELMAFWGDLERLEATRRHNDAVLSLQSGNLDDSLVLTPGAHCRFCPSNKFCLAAEVQ